MGAVASGFPKVVRDNPAVMVRVYVSGTTRGVQVRLRAKRHGDAIQLEWLGPDARAFAQEVLEACDDHDQQHAAEAANALGLGLRALDMHGEYLWHASKAFVADGLAEGCRWLSRRCGPWNHAERYFQGVLAVEAACRALSRELPDDASMFSLDAAPDAPADCASAAACDVCHVCQMPQPCTRHYPPALAEDSLDVFTL